MGVSRVVIYRRPHEASHAATAAAAAGFTRHGIGIEVLDHDVPVRTPPDLVLMWSVKFPAVIDDCHRHRRPFLVMETGFLGNPLGWVSLGYNGLKGRANFCTDDVPEDRWRMHFAELLEPWRGGSGQSVVVMGQVATDAAVAGINVRAWLQQTVRQVKAVAPEAEVVFRPHPHPAHGVAAPEGARLSMGTLAEDLADACAVVTWNSNSGVDAILAGVPVIAMDEGSMVWPVSAHAITAEALAQHDEPDREDWGRRMAYCQWTHEELASGEAWAHLARRFAS